MADGAVVYRVLAADRPVQADFDALEDALDGIEKRFGLLFGYARSEDQPGARRHVWSEYRQGQASIELIDDDELPARYVQVASPDEQEREGLAEELGGHLPVVPVEELRAAARDRAEEDPAALVRMALGESAPPDHEAVEIVRTHLNPDAPRPRREAAVTAAALLRSPELVPHLERLRDAEEDPNERQAIEQAIHDSEEVA